MRWRTSLAVLAVCSLLAGRGHAIRLPADAEAPAQTPPKTEAPPKSDTPAKADAPPKADEKPPAKTEKPAPARGAQPKDEDDEKPAKPPARFDPTEKSRADDDIPFPADI